MEVSVYSEDLNLRETIIRRFDTGSEVVPLCQAVAGPVGDALLCRKLEGAVIVLKDPGTDGV